ncbi:glycan-binding surface protein [uncultured Mucilaginibacter sp.]|uniref:glycan-binding surface protein n=1 Tax=uncultured Mucilaginibacter sp. TaxID=797541 RepID=UPI0025E7D09F|nr:glycan-binding surface protein [uncultured Mucilaginibacter sp.]
MKKLRFTNHIVALSMAFVSLHLAACKKDKDNSGNCDGTPTITKVVKPTDRTITVTSGNLREFVTIQGTNLCGVQEVMFNNIKVTSADFYATADEVTVRIPTSVPNPDQITNKLTVTTPTGNATTTFAVNIPAISITGVDNEYAPAGTTMTLFGPSFGIYGFTGGKGKVFFGNTEATITKATADTLQVTVPAGVAQNSPIKVVADNGSNATYAYPYMDNTNMMFDFDTKTGTAAGFITNSATPGAISGKYMRIAKSTGTWAADEIVRGTAKLPQDVVDHPDQYLYKFEINTQVPFNQQGIRMWADYGDSGTYYLWNPTVSPFDTRGKWITYSIPLLDIVKKPTIVARTNNDYTFRSIVYGPTPFTIDLSMDNIRIVHK